MVLETTIGISKHNIHYIKQPRPNRTDHQSEPLHYTKATAFGDDLIEYYIEENGQLKTDNGG